MDHTGNGVPSNATFDIDEMIIIEAEVEWEEDPPENWIVGVVKTDGGVILWLYIWLILKVIINTRGIVE